MKGQMTLNRYRRIDLTLLTAITAIFEIILVTAATRWFPNEPYTVSVVPVMVTIVVMRWGLWAALPALVGGAALCIASHALSEQYIIYCLGNLPGLSVFWMKKRLGSERIRQSTSLSLLMGLAVGLLMEAGRAIFAILLGKPPAIALGFFTTDVITLLFTLILIWIVRRLDGFFEDQREYLVRINLRQEEERGGYR